MAARDATPPPPVIGKAGRYTVFITPPPTPKPPAEPSTPSPHPSGSPRAAAAAAAAVAPPVQVPPLQFEKPAAAGRRRAASGSAFGFFWDAVARVQDAHSSLDEYLADWFGLNQSKYQWALNDYYEAKGSVKESSKQTELAGKQ